MQCIVSEMMQFESSAAPPEVKLSVRNTFIDCESTVGALLTDEERVALLQPRGIRRTKTCGESLLWMPPCSDDESEESSDERCIWRKERCSTADSLDSISTQASPRMRFSSQESFDSSCTWEEPLAVEVAVADVPARALRGEWSVGAEGHAWQQCKPCAFLDSRKGCLQGSACQYCHLCEPGEKKRRLKEKKSSLRVQQRQMASNQAAAQL